MISDERKFEEAGRGVTGAGPREPGCDTEARQRLRVRTIERTAVVDFVGPLDLFGEALFHAVSDRLHCLVEQEGYRRLLLNLHGVRYLSSDVLGTLAALHRVVGPERGRIQLCGLDPLLRDLLRITRLDEAFDVYADEAEALGLDLHGVRESLERKVGLSSARPSQRSV